MAITVGRADNQKAADLFYELALAMELRGEKWRANSYLRAAQSIEGATEHLRSLSERGELRRIEGVGESIEAKLEEFLNTGRIEALEQVKDILPEDLELLKRIPSLGIKRIGELDMQLGVRSVDDLLRAAEQGILSDLPDFDEGSERRTLEYLSWRREEAAEIPAPYALRSAHRIIDFLRPSPGLRRLELTGPIRRRSAMVANIMLLFSADEPADIIARFGLCPEVTELILVEKTQAMGRTTSGAACMLRAVEEDRLGFEQLRTTGPDVYFQFLNERAREVGIRLGGRHFPTEQSVYEALQLEPLPPEMRGVAECAGDSVRAADMKGDLHVRCRSFDGALRVLEMAVAAKNLGLEHICICDRLGDRKMDAAALERRNALIDETADLLGLTILKGAEVDITPDGKLDFRPGALEQLDLVMGAVNTSLTMDREDMTARVLRAMGDPLMDVLGHPSGRIIGLREPLELDLARVAEEARDRNIALEANAYPDRLDLDAEMIRSLHGSDALFCMGTDAAFPNEMAYWEWAAGTAVQSCLPPARFLNTLPADRITGRRWRS